MRLIQITPGAGGMYCGNCFRDNALAAALRKLGHETLLVPLYLPLRVDEPDQSTGAPIFYGGISVFLDQKFPWFRRLPNWVRRLFASPTLLRWAAGKAARTRPEDSGDLLISMLRGEEGNQATELEELLEWLKTQPKPDVICLSNALLSGLARRLRIGLGAKVAVMLQGEEPFLDSLPDDCRRQAWNLVAERVRELDWFIVPSRYVATRMTERLGLPQERIRVVHNGINLDGYQPASPLQPTLGYFARMCPDKGLDLLVDVFIELKRRGKIPNLRLKVGGGCGPSDEPFVKKLQSRLISAGLLNDFEFHPNLDRAAKIQFYRSLSVFSVPALYGEAFGLYILEALAAAVPVVQPDVAAFPELIQTTGGGLLAKPTVPSMADAIEELLLNPNKARILGETGRKAVLEAFSIEQMAKNFVAALK